jgi:MFS family permease
MDQPAAPYPEVPMDVHRVQRRTVSLLVCTQIVGGVGVAIGISVGALLAASLAGTGFSGLASSAAVVGGALLAVPATRIIRAHGRRPGLAFAYGAGALGALVVVAGATVRAPLLMFAGMMLFGGGTAANLQARYAAVDLAEPARRGRDLSVVVWATTIGAVAGPNLAPLADGFVRPYGLAEYAGPFAFSALAFAVAAVAIWLLLRPDPLLVARPVAVEPTAPRGAGLRQAVGVVRANPSARLGIAAVSVGHVMMIAVMSMTPLYITAYIPQHGDALRVVGIVLSLHIAGMYAFSPLVGWLSDRVGRRPVILGGIVALLAACAVAGTAAHHTPMLSLGLALLGWSATMVGGSTLLSESVPAAVRPSVQGLSDLVMGLAGASAGAVSGLVVDWAGYPTLTAVTAVVTVPLLALALRRPPRLAFSEGD